MRRQSLTIIGVVFSIIAFWGATAEAQNEIPVIASISPGVVVEGELLTIMGTNLVREGATTRVLIDETSVGYDTTDSGDLTVLVNTLPSTSQSTGEVERTVTVVVDGAELRSPTLRSGILARRAQAEGVARSGCLPRDRRVNRHDLQRHDC